LWRLEETKGAKIKGRNRNHRPGAKEIIDRAQRKSSTGRKGNHRPGAKEIIDRAQKIIDRAQNVECY
jgi:hypothetical protein